MNYENENNFLETLIKRISKLPGLGPRSARRIIFYLLKNKELHLRPIIESLIQVEKNIKKCWQVNAVATNNILKACKINNINHLIFTSSSEVYGEQIYEKIDEKHPLLGKNIYALSKIASENYITDFRRRNKKSKGRLHICF